MKKFLLVLSLIFVSWTWAQIDFTVTPTSGCNPVDVQFQFDGDATGVATLYFDLGNGDELSGAISDNFSYTYNTSGSFTVMMFALDANDEVLGFNTHTVEVTGPFVSASLTTAGLGESINFSIEGTHTSVSWDFGDGATSTESSLTHSYAAAGTYDVTATVESTDCGTQTLTVSIEVLGFDFSFTPESGCTPQDVTFSFSGDTNNVAFYIWDFGDGENAFAGNSGDQMHTYTQSGSFEITLTLFDGFFQPTGSLTKSIMINGLGIDSDFEITNPGQQINFTALGVSSGSVNWDFGDGNTTTELNPSHSYASPGVYEVKMTSVSSLCGEQTATRTITIANMQVSATINGTCTLPASVNFSFTGDVTPAFLAWDFGDDSTAFGQDAMLTHDYLANGSYTVFVSLFDDFFNDLGTVQVDVHIGATVQASNMTPSVAENVLFEVNGEYNSVSWNFGDGNTSTDNVAEHAFASTGNYWVVATIETPDCGTIMDSVEVIVKDISYQITNNSVCLPAEVAFAYTGSDADAVLFYWNFGDGNDFFGSATTVTHTYTSPGTYTVDIEAYTSTLQELGARSYEVVINGGAGGFELQPMGSLIICEGDSLVINSPVTAGLTWSTGETSSSIVVKDAGQIWAVSSNQGCEAKSDTLNITTAGLPTVDAGTDVEVCAGSEVTLNGSGADSYVWDNGVQDGVAFTPSDTTVYTVTGTDANGCKNTDQVTVNVNACAGLDELGQEMMKLYPNPSQGIVHIESNLLHASWELSNLLGEKLLEGSGNAEVDLRQLPDGMYLIRLKDKNGYLRSAQRLILNR
ncbi:MAG: PKD domain-containing protein [Bacteroidetes bacterium]|nr:MAG: PKD domain-containing protein [Bacteroidota bacterium]